MFLGGGSVFMPWVVAQPVGWFVVGRGVGLGRGIYDNRLWVFLD